MLTAQKNKICPFRAPCLPNLVEDFTIFAKDYQRQEKCRPLSFLQSYTPAVKHTPDFVRAGDGE